METLGYILICVFSYAAIEVFYYYHFGVSFIADTLKILLEDEKHDN